MYTTNLYFYKTNLDSLKKKSFLGSATGPIQRK